MVNHDSYYQDIIGKINHHINANEWVQAMKLVKNELEMPYIPSNYEVTLQDLYHEIAANIRVNSKPQVYEWNLTEITKVLMNPFDEELHPVAFYYLQSHNVRLILPAIKKYLASKDFNNINKTQLLFLLSNQGIDETITVVKTHGTFQINPKQLMPCHELPIYISVMKLFEDEVHIDNPGIYDICLFLLNSYVENLLPELPDNNQVSALAAALYVHACSFQSITVTLITSANKFQTTTNLVKKYLNIIKQQKIT
ncbi:DUF3196 family protein [Spiroplasma sp. AdecLV25b]|uniref:DUF3196 family protein n=1 Tax=Spiroplasma sp. AdecLV25b TaxID=3027162 RepID=UPI0027E15981|nr:DUF3196 family protein [Spiroplasma sp. AdecLV25b]